MKRYCMDLDGVIANLQEGGRANDYSLSKPNIGVIVWMRERKREGDYLIIYTARRMRTHNGNVGAAIAEIGQVTIEWLKKHGVPYDELHFGKPWADVYIDDNAIRYRGDVDLDVATLTRSQEKQLEAKAP